MARLTMPRKYRGPAPAGERRASCAYCGFTYYRGTMTRDAAGFLRCSETGCADGRDAVTLDRENAESASAALSTSRGDRLD